MSHHTNLLPLKSLAVALGLTVIPALVTAPALASAKVIEGDVIGTTEAAIKSQLETQGYEVKEIEIDDDEIEVEVVLKGKEYEIEIDVTTGKITEIEEED